MSSGPCEHRLTDEAMYTISQVTWMEEGDLKSSVWLFPGPSNVEKTSVPGLILVLRHLGVLPLPLESGWDAGRTGPSQDASRS